MSPVLIRPLLHSSLPFCILRESCSTILLAWLFKNRYYSYHTTLYRSVVRSPQSRLLPELLARLSQSDAEQANPGKRAQTELLLCCPFFAKISGYIRDSPCFAHSALPVSPWATASAIIYEYCVYRVVFRLRPSVLSEVHLLCR